MSTSVRFRIASLVAALASLPLGCAASRVALRAPAAKGLTIDDVIVMKRVSGHDVSPDGRWIAFTVRETDLEANRGRTDLWMVAADGQSPARRLTTHPENDHSPAWSPDGGFIYFLSSRSGSSQVWRISPAGGESEQVTKLPLGVGGFKVFPDGRRLIVAMDVWPDAKTVAESVARDEAEKKKKVKARIYDQALFRHWDQWEDGRYSHLFVWSPEKPDDAIDLTPGMTTDSPTRPWGGMEEVALSPDGQTLAFVARVGGRAIAWTTNTDVFLVPTSGKGKTENLTVANEAYDFSPAFSPDGKWLAVTSMTRPGYESDRTRIKLYDLSTKEARVLTEAWDRSPHGVTWSADGKTLYTSVSDLGNRALFAVSVADGNVRKLVAKGYNRAPRMAGDHIVYLHDSLRMPAEIFSIPASGGEPKAVTHFNDAHVARITWGEYEQYNFTGAHGDTVYGYVVKPAGFTTGRKYPVAVIVHGGPQGSMGDHFHYRWNPQILAGHGYGVVFVDFHGSTGYGQAFTDSIREDWGGAPFEDVMKGLDAAVEKYPWLDGKRVGALGASYGGYMINWIAGKAPDRFKALVCHDGNLDNRFAALDTEELWFDEWDHGGTIWDNPEGYSRHNPIDLIKNWKTPMLVIHGAQDYRVVEAHGMATFNALQRRGIPSRFLYFPDENHWVLKPLNSQLWYREVLSWLDRYVAGKK